jgi:hypothetical protein
MRAFLDAAGGRPQRGASYIVLVLIVLIAACLRLNGITRETLWLDEVYSATFAVQHPFDLIVAVWRFDVHPPLYYLQLHVWALVSNNTIWLFLNSVAWSIATVVSVFFTTKRIYGERVATGAALILALLPSDIFYSHQLRMYAMVSCIGVWCWYAVYQAIRKGVPGRSALYVTVAELTLGYSHGSGAVNAFVFAIYGFLLAFQEKRQRIEIRRWLLLQAAIGVLLLPAVVNSSVRSLSHIAVPDLQQVIETFGFLVFGLAAPSSLILRIAASAVFLSILGAAVRGPSRAVARGLVLVPIGLLFIASHLVRPIWIDRALLFITPFMALVLSSTFTVVCDHVRARWQWRRGTVIANGMALGFLVLAGFLGFSELRNYEKPTRYEMAARTIWEEFQPGDLVYAPGFVSFWGIAWYLLGPSWGSILAVQDPIQQSPSTDKWPAVLHWLGPKWREMLHLEPVARSVPAMMGGKLIIGWTFPPELQQAKRVWIVDRNPPDIAAQRMSPLVETGVTDFHGIWLRRFEAPELEGKQ